MKTLFAIFATFIALNAYAMTCTSNTIIAGGRMTICTTCCSASGCMTTCL